MTKKEAKHLSDVLKAYSEGKEIEIKNGEEGWIPVCKDPWFAGNPMTYRIKPEPKYRPYKSIKEFIDAKQKHGEVLIKPNTSAGYFPVRVNSDCVGVITMYCEGECKGEYISFSDLLIKKWTWMDNTPCGILEN